MSGTTSLMNVIKRDGRREVMQPAKILKRLEKLAAGLDECVDVKLVAKITAQGLYDDVRTTDLDGLSSETAAYMASYHPDYAALAARVVVSNLHKETPPSFSEAIEIIVASRTSVALRAEFVDAVRAHKDVLDKAIDHRADYGYDYFGMKTLMRDYLLKVNGKIIERPQYMLMRVALGINLTDIEQCLETYRMLSSRLYTHASPTLFSTGTTLQQLASCFLLDMKEDSIKGIFATLTDCADISRAAGGIGIAIHKIRASGSFIRGTGGHSNGLVPLLRMYNSTARYVDQGGNKRPGSFAIYLEPWHADIEDFLDLKRNTGKPEERARDLFYALWIPDLFMKRVQEDGDWSLMCPNECPGLHEVWGDEFEKLYERYEKEGRQRRTIPARKLWTHILDVQIETGTPYMVYKDACNRKSNQQHLGTIKSSNLCTEIIQYSAPDETAVCNLASIALPSFVDAKNHSFDFKRLAEVVRIVTFNLNRVIDVTTYPIEDAKRSNLRHRPIGIGVVGLADVFHLLKMGFDSEEALSLDRDIFETMYFAALSASCELAKKHGTYSTYEGSPLSRGVLQWAMWGKDVKDDRHNWTQLAEDIKKYGVRNSLLLSLMPTASTSQILGYNECFEPYTSNLYHRRVKAGEFYVVNSHLIRELSALGLWNEEMRQLLLAGNGSVQHVSELPEDIRRRYRTAYELSQRDIIDHAIVRSPFIDQSQSMSLFVKDASHSKLTSMHFYAWRQGIKTGMYYLRTNPATDPIKFTVDPLILAKKNASDKPNSVSDVKNAESEEEEEAAMCSRLNGPNCTACSV